MRSKLTDDERARIVADLRGGKSQNRTAKDAKRSPSLVNKIAREEGIENIRVSKKASEGRKAYAEERRLEIIGKGFDKADDLLSPITDAKEFQSWSVGFATLIDKARLETGEATNRTENVDPSRRSKMKASLDEIAAQRRKHTG